MSASFIYHVIVMMLENETKKLLDKAETGVS